MRQITNTELLKIGTRVQVNDKRGIIVKAEMSKDQFSIPICLHTIEYRQKWNQGGRSWKPILKPRQSVCNYSFIYVI